MRSKTLSLNDRTWVDVAAFTVQISQVDSLGAPQHITLTKEHLLHLVVQSGILADIPPRTMLSHIQKRRLLPGRRRGTVTGTVRNL